jgi:metal-dependent amidase/aminoacylase/carboxypeptidase family protein
MFGIGSGEHTPALHNPDYDFPDAIIPTGVNLFYEIATNILRKDS